MANILSIFSVLKELFNLIKMIKAMIDKKELADVEKRRQELDKAIEDIKKAQSHEEFLNAQKRIVDASNK